MHFRTTDPQIGEVMMQSRSDFPKRTAEIQEQFDRLYGTESGKFAEILREAATQGESAEIKTGIAGLSLHVRDLSGQIFGLVDRPNNHA